MLTATDSELMTLTCEDDHEAFAVIVERHKDSLINYLTHLTGSRDKAEETAQEAFVRLYQSRARYDDRGQLSHYLFRIATNLVRSEWRRSNRWRLLMLDFGASDAIETTTPHVELARSELQRRLQEALRDLPLAYRSAVVLREIEGWSYDEIAVALDCSVGTIKSRINRGRELLRKALAPYWNGAPK